MGPEVQDDRGNRGGPHPGEDQPADFFSTETCDPAIEVADWTDR
jgi:hypothetical protein